jgi:acyl-CoA thioesterase FadM
MISTRWPVLQAHDVAGSDLDPDGFVTDDALERWIAEVRAAYLDQCARLQAARASRGIELRLRTGALPRGAELGQPASVVASASATEVFPTSFVISMRLRATGGESDELVNASCTVELEDPATGAVQEIVDEIRDELIALEHSARHFN